MGKKSLSIVFGTLVVLAVGCGGRKGGQTTVLSCEPSEAPVGATVVCQSKDIADDCTLFFGNSPVEFTSNPDEGTVSFVVPPTLPGEKDIKVQCGDEDGLPLGKFLVPVPAGGETATPPAGDDTILPSGDPEGADGAGESEGDEPARGLAGKLEKVGSHPLTVMNVNGFIQIESMRNLESNAHFSTYKVTFNVPGNPRAVYLSGNLFNRKPSDDHLDDGVNPCGKLGEGASERYLATQADGSKLNEGSAVYEQNAPYLTGEVCDEGEDCRHGLESDERNPWCKIIPKNAAGELIVSGEFYTRSLVERGMACIAVQNQNDEWTVDCDSVAAPQVEVTETNVDVSQDRPVVSLRFSYANAEKVPAILGSGCHKTGGSAAPDNLGNGTYEAECPITSDKKTFGASFSGIGERNNAGRFYALELGTPVTGFRIGEAPASNDKGEVGLFYDVSRPYTLQGSDALLGGEAAYSVSKSSSCPWAKGIQFAGRYVVDGSKVTNPYRKIESAADASGRIAGDKDYDSMTWSFQAQDFKSHGVDSGGISQVFPFSFSLVGTSGSWNYNYQYDECDGAFEDAKDECCQGSNCPHDSSNAGAYGCGSYRVYIQFGWVGENVSAIKMTCTPKGESNESAFTVNLPVDQSTWVSGRINGEKVSCDFTVTSKMGTTLTANYTYSRGEGVCDGPDRGGNDHNDAGFDD